MLLCIDNRFDQLLHRISNADFQHEFIDFHIALPHVEIDVLLLRNSLLLQLFLLLLQKQPSLRGPSHWAWEGIRFGLLLFVDVSARARSNCPRPLCCARCRNFLVLLLHNDFYLF